jgi:hypothetical protein
VLAGLLVQELHAYFFAVAPKHSGLSGLLREGSFDANLVWNQIAVGHAEFCTCFRDVPDDAIEV